jgi:ABC-type glycerol-3-phosphate transport system substrate-binding protein
MGSGSRALGLGLAMCLSLVAVPAATVAQDGEVTIDVWTHEFEPLQTALLEKWIPEFEAANPDVKVNLTSIPFAGVVSYDTKLLAALSSGTGPDVWDMGDWNYPVFKENGFLEPLDPAVFGYETDQEFIDSFRPGSTAVLEQDGALVGLFSEFNTLNMFYNRDLFEEVGIAEPPTDRPLSWDEVGEIGQALRLEDDGILERIGLQLGYFANFRSPQWAAQHYYTFLRQHGQDDIYIDGAPAANTDAAIAAFQEWADLQYEYGAYDPTFLNNWFADVPDGRAGMVLAGTWYPAAALGNVPDFDFGVVPNPVLDPDDPSTYHNISWLWGWSVNAASSDAEKAAAQEFLAFILGKKGETEQTAYWFENLGYFQPSNVFLESEAYASALEESPWLDLWVTAFDTYQINAVPHSYDEAGAALVRAIDRVIFDGASAEEAAEQLQAELVRAAG